MYPKCGNLCDQRGRKRFIASWGQDVTHLSLHPMPLPPGYRSKVESRHFAHLWVQPEPVFVNLLRSPGICSQPGGPVRQPYLLYQPTRLHRLAELIPRNRFQGSLNVYRYGLRELLSVQLHGGLAPAHCDVGVLCIFQ
jgi:hypothetical protein